jgi:exosortase
MDRPLIEQLPSVAALPARRTTMRSLHAVRRPLLLTALLLAGWSWTLAQMWLRWFPTWTSAELPLTDRFLSGHSYYNHGPLAILVSLLIACHAAYRPADTARTSPTAASLGWVLLISGAAIHLLSVTAGVMFVSGFAALPVIAGVVLVLGGWPRLRLYLPAILLLSFAIPLPVHWVGDVAFALKQLAGSVSTLCLSHLLGIPAVFDASAIHVPLQTTGERQRLLLEGLCSGLRSLVSLVWFAAVFATICDLPRRWRLAILASALPVALAVNILRLTTLGLGAHWWGAAAVAPETFLHQASGLFLFVLAAATWLTLARAVRASEPPQRRLERDRATPARSRINTHRDPLRLRNAGVALTLIATVLLSWGAAPAPDDATRHPRPTNPLPATLSLESPTRTTFTRTDRYTDRPPRRSLRADAEWLQQYAAPDGHTTIDVAVTYSATRRMSSHPPEACLVADGHVIIAREAVSVDTSTRGTPVPLRLVLTENDGQQRYHAYVFWYGDEFTTSFLYQQARVFAGTLLRQPIGGAAITIATPVATSPDHARARLLAAAQRLLGPIDGALQ